MIIVATYEPDWWRVRIVVTEIPDTYPTSTLWRRTSERPVWEVVRSAYDVDTGTGGMIVYDYEAPYGQVVTYAVTTGTTTPNEDQPDPGGIVGDNVAPNGSAEHGLDGWAAVDEAMTTLDLDDENVTDGTFAVRSTRRATIPAPPEPPPADVDVTDVDTSTAETATFDGGDGATAGCTTYIVFTGDSTVNPGATMTRLYIGQDVAGDSENVRYDANGWAADADLDLRRPDTPDFPADDAAWVTSVADSRVLAASGSILIGRSVSDPYTLQARIQRVLIYYGTIHDADTRRSIEQYLAVEYDADTVEPVDPETSAVADLTATPAQADDPAAVPVEPGTNHQITADIGTQDSIDATVTVSWVDATNTPTGEPTRSEVVRVDDLAGWKTIIVEAVAPADAAAAVVGVAATTASGGPAVPGQQVWVDRVEVAPVDEWEGSVATTTITLPLTGQPVLKHLGLPYLSTPVIVQTIGPISRPGRYGIHEIMGRREPVVVHDVRSSRRGQVVLYTQTIDENDALRAIFAEGAPLLLQVPCVDVDFDDCYMAVTDVEETQLWPSTPSPKRLWSMDYVEVARPPGDVAPAGYRNYQDVVDTFATYQDVDDANDNYLMLALGTALVPTSSGGGA